jgi:hypothetical protein
MLLSWTGLIIFNKQRLYSIVLGTADGSGRGGLSLVGSRRGTFGLVTQGPQLRGPRGGRRCAAREVTRGAAWSRAKGRSVESS